MQPPPFAANMDRVNRAVMARLSDAVAAVGGREFAVLFERPYAGEFDGQVDAANPQCTGSTADLGGLQRGDTITINGAAWRIVRAEPDGAGLTRLVLATVD